MQRVGLIMGSLSDRDVVAPATEVLDSLRVGWEWRVLSAHRSPEAVAEFGRTAADRGLGVLIAAAGGAAHLPGVLAAYTVLPVIGLPVKGAGPGPGLDALLAMVQMPAGIPVATVGLDNARNAALLAAAILAVADPELSGRLQQYRRQLAQGVAEADGRLQASLGERAGS